MSNIIPFAERVEALREKKIQDYVDGHLAFDEVEGRRSSDMMTVFRLLRRFSPRELEDVARLLVALLREKDHETTVIPFDSQL